MILRDDAPCGDFGTATPAFPFAVHSGKKGHRIVGLKYAALYDGYSALFPWGVNSTIRNLTLDGCGNYVTIGGKTTSVITVSPLVGEANWSMKRQVTIENVTVLSNCTYYGGQRTGGIAAYLGNKDGRQKYDVSGNTNNANVLTNSTNASEQCAGGIVGACNGSGSFQRNKNNGTVKSMEGSAGWLLGYNRNGSIDSNGSANTGRVTRPYRSQFESYSGKSAPKIGSGSGAASAISEYRPWILGGCATATVWIVARKKKKKAQAE